MAGDLKAENPIQRARRVYGSAGLTTPFSFDKMPSHCLRDRREEMDVGAVAYLENFKSRYKLRDVDSARRTPLTKS